MSGVLITVVCLIAFSCLSSRDYVFTGKSVASSLFSRIN